MSKLKIKPWVWLVLILILALSIRLYFFTGLNCADDFAYVGSVFKILNLDPGDLGSYFDMRTLLNLPLSFFVYLFGVNEFSFVMYPLLASLTGIWVVYLFGKYLFGYRVGLLAALLLSVFPLDVIHATRVMPDIPLHLFLGLSVLFFLMAEKTVSKMKSKLFYLLTGIAIGSAYLVKITAVIILLFYSLFILVSISKNHKFNKNWLLIAIGLLFVILLEGSYFYVATGNPFSRIETMSSTLTYQTGLYSWASSLAIYPHYFLGFIPTDKILEPDSPSLFFYFLTISLIYIIIRWKKFDKKQRYGLFFILLWFFSLFFYLEFGSQSLIKFVPVAKDLRFLTIIILPTVLIISYFLSDIYKKSKILALVFIITLISSSLFFSNLSSNWWNYSGSCNDAKVPFYKIKEFLLQNNISKVYGNHYAFIPDILPIITWGKVEISVADESSSLFSNEYSDGSYILYGADVSKDLDFPTEWKLLAIFPPATSKTLDSLPEWKLFYFPGSSATDKNIYYIFKVENKK